MDSNFTSTSTGGPRACPTAPVQPLRRSLRGLVGLAGAGGAPEAAGARRSARARRCARALGHSSEPGDSPGVVGRIWGGAGETAGAG